MMTHVLGQLYGKPWLITKPMMDLMCRVVDERLTRGRIGLTAEETATLAKVRAQRGSGGAPTPKTVGVVPIHGVLAQRIGMLDRISGGQSTESIAQSLDELANDKSVSAIVLDVASPGGSVYGIMELAEKIRAAAKEKRVVAIANSQAASAAYWLAAQAPEFAVTPGGEVGSIGVVMKHLDLSAAYEMQGARVTFIHAGKYKVEGNDANALDSEAEQYFRETVESYYTDFVRAVAKGRKASTATVRSEFGEGRMVRARDAVDRGMADAVMTFDEVVERVAANRAVAPKQKDKAATRAPLRLQLVAADGFEQAFDIDTPLGLLGETGEEMQVVPGDTLTVDSTGEHDTDPSALDDELEIAKAKHRLAR